jgi:CRISPR-associated protein Cas2
VITRYLVSYDIADPDRLRKVHAVVKATAQRVQDSVYEALLTEKELVLLEARITKVMNQKEDQVMFIDLGRADRTELPEITTLGLPWHPQTRASIVL